MVECVTTQIDYGRRLIQTLGLEVAEVGVFVCVCVCVCGGESHSVGSDELPSPRLCRERKRHGRSWSGGPREGGG